MTDPNEQYPAVPEPARTTTPEPPAAPVPPAAAEQTPAAPGTPPDPLAPGFNAPVGPGFAAPQVPGYAAPPAPGFAPPPAPGYSAAPLPGYPAAPSGGYPGPQYAPARPRTGTVAWAMGFLIFIPIPLLGALVAGIVMPAVYSAASKGSDIARANARSAANWGLTFLLVSTILIVTHFVLLFTLTRDEPVRDFYPLGIPITLYLLICVAHVVLTIIGTVRAAQGNVMKVPFAIPYIKA